MQEILVVTASENESHQLAKDISQIFYSHGKRFRFLTARPESGVEAIVARNYLMGHPSDIAIIDIPNKQRALEFIEVAEKMKNADKDLEMLFIMPEDLTEKSLVYQLKKKYKAFALLKPYTSSDLMKVINMALKAHDEDLLNHLRLHFEGEEMEIKNLLVH